MGWLGAEFEWNDGWWAEEISTLGAELGLDTLNWGVGMGVELEIVEIG
jgi:hypothetical protein